MFCMSYLINCLVFLMSVCNAIGCFTPQVQVYEMLSLLLSQHTEEKVCRLLTPTAVAFLYIHKI